MKGWVIGLAVALAASSARPGPVEDANAGLAALQAGDNDGAIALFDRAIASGRLRGDDLEFAYAARGEAYLNKKDLPDAIVNLDRARQMKPDDKDAQVALVTAICAAQPAALVPGQNAGRVVGRLLGGMLAAGLGGQDLGGALGSSVAQPSTQCPQ
jgi:tetratricopeptide (TPR) repeat protein